MKLKRILSAITALSLLLLGMNVFAAEDKELFVETYDMTDAASDGENGIIKEFEVENGDYAVTVTTGGAKASEANIYINGGERVRKYTLNAGETQENVQPVAVMDGKITVQVLGENPALSEIKIEELAPRTEAGDKPTLYIAGDSTAQTYDYTNVFPQTGWGQVLSEYFTDDVIIENRSMGGRSAKSYNNDGRLDQILTEIKPGDYLFIQFGINDGDINKPERYISAEDYKKLIKDKYIGETIKRGGIPILLTATAASWWDEENQRFTNSRDDYAYPTREIARETGVDFIDANRIITDAWNKMDKDDVLSGYFICEPLESKVYPIGTNDHTHLKAKGARRIARLIAANVPEELRKYTKLNETFDDIEGHWAEEAIKNLVSGGFVQGVENGKFNPEGTVTRAEFLKMAMEASSIAPHAYREDECADASADDWYCYYLQGALDKDLIPVEMLGGDMSVNQAIYVLAEATEDKGAVIENINVYTGAFNGYIPITREEMAVIAMNCLSYAAKNSNRDLKLIVSIDKPAFVDSNIYEGYVNSIDAAVSYGLVDGMGDGIFAPKNTLTRAQAAAIVSRIYTLLK